MTLETFYENVGGSYEEISCRMPGDAFIKRYALGFLEDPSYAEFMELYENNGDASAIFRAIHTIKGVCLNLGFGSLAETSSVITEHFRPNNPTKIENIEEKIEELKVRYDYLIGQLMKLDAD